ncbi:Zinc finger MYND domain-containing 12 [Brachionus plicatilis]|uniref:Zinc finger MYND domain-containing 12 n=1 Tax=Brachionus plicatilis TaxID=10195 RepID=A0A3M7PXC6_BRAPC|nr:Zinc finger MYND domain-containing 12 [Brachionus plicatilis]
MTTARDTVYPLAFPKGTKFLCELCQKPATKICERCRVTYYCDNEHQHTDWFGIHEKICQSLVPLRISLPFLPSEEERRKRNDDLRNKKLQLIEYTRSIAQRYLFEGDYQRAIPGAMTSLKFVIELFGIKSVDLVPSYLILGEASQGLGNLSQAQEYLSQAEWTVTKSPDCPLPILSKLYRNIAMLQISKGDFDQALRNLANDIYYASEEFGTESFQVSGGYFLIANIFFKQGKMDVADSLYRQVVNMWHSHLEQVVGKKTEISELDTILGKKDDDEKDSESLDTERSNELASEAEAKKVLYSIYEIRRNETSQDIAELTKIEHCLCMVHFLSKEYDKVRNYSDLLESKSDLDEIIKANLTLIENDKDYISNTLDLLNEIEYESSMNLMDKCKYYGYVTELEFETSNLTGR